VTDPRIEAYARLLVDCVGPQPGWQVLVRSQPLGRRLVEEVSRELGR
jgi:leucyl aminopeptidase (aminopeptidase T)